MPLLGQVNKYFDVFFVWLERSQPYTVLISCFLLYEYPVQPKEKYGAGIFTANLIAGSLNLLWDV